MKKKITLFQESFSKSNEVLLEGIIGDKISSVFEKWKAQNPDSWGRIERGLKKTSFLGFFIWLLKEFMFHNLASILDELSTLFIATVMVAKGKLKGDADTIHIGKRYLKAIGGNVWADLWALVLLLICPLDLLAKIKKSLIYIFYIVLAKIGLVDEERVEHIIAKYFYIAKAKLSEKGKEKAFEITDSILKKDSTKMTWFRKLAMKLKSLTSRKQEMAVDRKVLETYFSRRDDGVWKFREDVPQSEDPAMRIQRR